MYLRSSVFRRWMPKYLAQLCICCSCLDKQKLPGCVAGFIKEHYTITYFSLSSWNLTALSKGTRTWGCSNTTGNMDGARRTKDARHKSSTSTLVHRSWHVSFTLCRLSTTLNPRAWESDLVSTFDRRLSSLVGQLSRSPIHRCVVILHSMTC